MDCRKLGLLVNILSDLILDIALSNRLKPYDEFNHDEQNNLYLEMAAKRNQVLNAHVELINENNKTRVIDNSWLYTVRWA